MEYTLHECRLPYLYKNPYHDFEILESWVVVDRWWTENPIWVPWVDVLFKGRQITFRKDCYKDNVWRIVNHE